MQVPLFYLHEQPQLPGAVLDEETSRHLVQVLRKKNGDQLQLTNGKGMLYDAVINEAHKKHTLVRITNEQAVQPLKERISIAISPVKNASRFEWFLEKATEIGISEIIPLMCTRTEKEKLKFTRLQQIVISAMLQSRQFWMPVLSQPVEFETIITDASYDQKLIAHCDNGEKHHLTDEVKIKAMNRLILIGPEGDFTAKEIELALSNHFKAVAIGTTRLRTETAGVVAASLLRLGN